MIYAVIDTSSCISTNNQEPLISDSESAEQYVQLNDQTYIQR